MASAAEQLAANLNRMRQVAPSSKICGVVKANAYGHGIERVFEALRGTDGFALLDLDEAQRVLDGATAMGARLAFLGEASYPDLLAHAEGAPPALWLRGSLAPSSSAVAIVGSRNASAASSEMSPRRTSVSV